MAEMDENRCRAIAREIYGDHQVQHKLESHIYLSTQDFNREHQILLAKVVTLEQGVEAKVGILTVQLSNIRTAVYVVMAILGSTAFLGLWKWALK